MSKNEKLLKSFTKYCEENPQQRFWQALRNWAGVAFILKAKGIDFETSKFTGITDTFYE